MLNNDLFTKAKDQLNNSIDRLNRLVETTVEASVQLHKLRADSSAGVLGEVDAFLRRLTSVPASYLTTLTLFQSELQQFRNQANGLQLQQAGAQVEGSAAAGTGVAVGGALALAGPTAGMAIATTFGTTSAGVAISSLSDAAATNAALAWLGGGALAAGGGGMAGGSALLALAGPVGLGLAALSMVGGAVYMNRKNAALAEEADRQRSIVCAQHRKTEAIHKEIQELIDLTRGHLDAVKALLFDVVTRAPTDYEAFDAERKSKLGSLIVHFQAVAELLNRRVNQNGRK